MNEIDVGKQLEEALEAESKRPRLTDDYETLDLYVRSYLNNSKPAAGRSEWPWPWPGVELDFDRLHDRNVAARSYVEDVLRLLRRGQSGRQVSDRTDDAFLQLYLESKPERNPFVAQQPARSSRSSSSSSSRAGGGGSRTREAYISETLETLRGRKSDVVEELARRLVSAALPPSPDDEAFYAVDFAFDASDVPQAAEALAGHLRRVHPKLKQRPDDLQKIAEALLERDPLLRRLFCDKYLSLEIRIEKARRECARKREAFEATLSQRSATESFAGFCETSVAHLERLLAEGVPQPPCESDACRSVWEHHQAELLSVSTLRGLRAALEHEGRGRWDKEADDPKEREANLKDYAWQLYAWALAAVVSDDEAGRRPWILEMTQTEFFTFVRWLFVGWRPPWAYDQVGSTVSSEEFAPLARHAIGAQQLSLVEAERLCGKEARNDALLKATKLGLDAKDAKKLSTTTKKALQRQWPELRKERRRQVVEALLAAATSQLLPPQPPPLFSAFKKQLVHLCNYKELIEPPFRPEDFRRELERAGASCSASAAPGAWRPRGR
jgi:hypothetical protein